MTDQVVILWATPRNSSHCRSCGAEITWFRTAKANRAMPVNGHETRTSTVDEEGREIVIVPAEQTHWATCPDAKTWRGGK